MIPLVFFKWLLRKFPQTFFQDFRQKFLLWFCPDNFAMFSIYFSNSHVRRTSKDLYKKYKGNYLRFMFGRPLQIFFLIYHADFSSNLSNHFYWDLSPTDSFRDYSRDSSSDYSWKSSTSFPKVSIDFIHNNSKKSFRRFLPRFTRPTILTSRHS